MTHTHDLETRLARLEGLQEVRRLVADYSHGADKRDLDLFLSVWHEDAVWDVGSARFTGRNQIGAAIQRQWETQPFMAHWTANLSVDLTAGSTRAVARVDTDTLTQLASGEWLQSAGTYDDVLQLRDGRWGFVERRATLHTSLALTARPADLEQPRRPG